MLSWRLFRALNVYHDHPLRRHPVYQRERRHLGAQSPLPNRRLRGILLALVLAAFMVGVWIIPGIDRSLICLVPLCWFAPLLLLLPVLPVWILPISLGLAPAVTLNRLRGRWTLLCVAPLDQDQLLMALARAALERTRSLLVWLLVALMPLSWLIGTGFAEGLLRYIERSDLFAIEDPRVVSGIGVSLWALGTLVMYADRLQQTILMGTGAMLGGTFVRRSVRSAVLYGALGAWALWLLEFTIGSGIVLLTPGSRPDKVLAIAVCLFGGPVPGFLVALPLAWALLMVALTFVLREVLLRVLWGALRRAAREIA